jgi:hypothetical protein
LGTRIKEQPEAAVLDYPLTLALSPKGERNKKIKCQEYISVSYET